MVEARPRLYREFHYRIVDAVNSVVPVHEIFSVDEMVCRHWKNEATLSEALRLA